MGGMTVTGNGKTVKYVWDYIADKAVLESEMKPGTARWMESERARWAAIKAATKREPAEF